MDKLPDDILQIILGKFSNMEEIRHLMRVCKRWRILCKRVERLQLPRSPNVMSPIFWRGISKFPNLTSLIIRNIGVLITDPIGVSFPRLRELRFLNPLVNLNLGTCPPNLHTLEFHIPNEPLEIEGLQSVSHLQLECKTLTKFEQMSNIRILDLTYRSITVDTIQSLLKNPLLQTLKLQASGRPSPSYHGTLVVGSTSLVKLTVSGTEVEKLVLTGCSSLKELELSKMKSVILNDCPSLEELEVKKVDSFRRDLSGNLKRLSLYRVGMENEQVNDLILNCISLDPVLGSDRLDVIGVRRVDVTRCSVQQLVLWGVWDPDFVALLPSCVAEIERVMIRVDDCSYFLSDLLHALELCKYRPRDVCIKVYSSKKLDHVLNFVKGCLDKLRWLRSLQVYILARCDMEELEFKQIPSPRHTICINENAKVQEEDSETCFLVEWTHMLVLF